MQAVRNRDGEDAMKWTLFLLSLFALFAANNALFWLPGSYDWFNFVAAGIAIFVAAILAWFSSKRFVQPTSGALVTWNKVVMAPPAVIWLFVILLFCLLGLMKIVVYYR
jgi:hypothetical protein